MNDQKIAKIYTKFLYVGAKFYVPTTGSSGRLDFAPVPAMPAAAAAAAAAALCKTEPKNLCAKLQSPPAPKRRILNPKRRILNHLLLAPLEIVAELCWKYYW